MVTEKSMSKEPKKKTRLPRAPKTEGKAKKAPAAPVVKVDPEEVEVSAKAIPAPAPQVAVASATPPAGFEAAAVESASTTPVPAERVVPFKDGDDYSLICYYDKSARHFVGEVLEFPDLKTTGSSREAVIRDLNMKLEDHIEDTRHQVNNFPEPVHSRQYPDKLDVPLSQSLYRKLDLLSRLEKRPIDRVVTELLASGIEKRFDSTKSQNKGQSAAPSSNQHHRHGGGGQHRHGGHGGHRHQHQGQRHGGQHGQGPHENKDNFLEYVRSLEKGGWKKR